jgi:predicted MPP superfamily phosphohydrolase
MLTNRRLFQILLGAGGALAGVGLYTRFIEPGWVKCVEQPMPIRRLPPPLFGETLVQFSDLHIGASFNWTHVLKAFAHIRRLQPGFVVYTGDFISYRSPVQLDQLSEALTHAPRGRLGTVAVLGNHDYGHHSAWLTIAARVEQRLIAAGIAVLRNQVGVFSGLQFGGFDDWWGDNFDGEAVTRRLDPGLPTVVLTHNPDTVDLPIWHGYQGWILAGHTHGGQVKPPFLPPPCLPVHNKRYAAGFFDLGDGRFLYVNRGLGASRPLRFNVRPEVTIFHLE